MARVDGRANDDLRPVKITLGYQDYPEGSALIEMGNTRVLCAVSVEDRVPHVPEGAGHRLGDRRVCNVAAGHSYPHVPQS